MSAAARWGGVGTLPMSPSYLRKRWGAPKRHIYVVFITTFHPFPLETHKSPKIKIALAHSWWWWVGGREEVYVTPASRSCVACSVRINEGAGAPPPRPFTKSVRAMNGLTLYTTGVSSAYLPAALQHAFREHSSSPRPTRRRFIHYFLMDSRCSGVHLFLSLPLSFCWFPSV